MKKNDLRNGDIVILRNGDLGLFMAGEDVFIYQYSGYDIVDLEYEDDLISAEECPELDVMRVYRAESGVISFADYEEGDLIFERDETWCLPEKLKKKPREAEETVRVEEPVRKERKDVIRIVTQAFYGNRTMTEIRLDKMDAFILGYLDSSLCDGKKFDRTVIRVPNTDDLVFVYNKYQEERKRQDIKDFESKRWASRKPLLEIPEENICLYSRCIVCRMDEDGNFKSLEEDDCPKFMKYLAE